VLDSDNVQWLSSRGHYHVKFMAHVFWVWLPWADYFSSLWLVLSLNNSKNHKMKISKNFKLKVNKIVEYFAFLMTKFVNTKYRHLYKQPPSTSNPLDTFCFSYNSNWLPWWLFWHCSFCLLENLDYVCLRRNRWDIPRLEKHE
jgi:hypothetical protein